MKTLLFIVILLAGVCLALHGLRSFYWGARDCLAARRLRKENPSEWDLRRTSGPLAQPAPWRLKQKNGTTLMHGGLVTIAIGVGIVLILFFCQ